MARTRTLTQLRDEVRQRADVEGATTWLTDAELTRLINQSCTALRDQLIDLGEGYYDEEQTITTAAGTELYSIATFYRLIGPPEVDLGAGQPMRMRRWQWADRVSYLYEGGWTYDRPIAYRLRGADKISFLPVPSGVHTVELHYVKPHTDLSADADTYDGRNGWEEWVVLDAAIKVAVKGEGDITELAGERDRVYARIAKAAATQDASEPDRVQDVGD